MKKIRKFAIFLLLPLHLFMIFGMRGMGGSVMTAVIVFTLLADAALSFLQMELLTSKRNSIGLYVSEFCPYLVEKVLIGVIEFGIFKLTGGASHNILSESWGKLKKISGTKLSPACRRRTTRFTVSCPASCGERQGRRRIYRKHRTPCFAEGIPGKRSAPPWNDVSR